MIEIIHVDGSGEADPDSQCLSRLYDELRSADIEHGEVAVVDSASDWAVSAHPDGRVVLDRLETRGRMARHMNAVPRDRVIQLWHSLIGGDMDAILAEPWFPGYAD